MAKVSPNTGDIELKDLKKEPFDVAPSAVGFFKRTLGLTPNVLSTIFIGSSALVLLIGLVSGLVIRPDNCVTPSTAIPITVFYLL